MENSRILFAMVIVALQGFTACKSDDVSPQSLSQQAQNLVKENNLKKVEVIPDSEPLVYLKSVENAALFLASLKNKLISNAQPLKTPWVSPRSENGMITTAVFTFGNNANARLAFDEKGNISSVKVNGNAEVAYNYDASTGYLSITKWGIIALPLEGKNAFAYYAAPITRWEAYLNSSWSCVRNLNTEANESLGNIEMINTTEKTPTKPSLGGNGDSDQIVPVPNH